MNLNIDRLKSLLGELRVIGLWDRIFHWNRVRNQLIDAAEDLQKFNASIEYIRNLQNADINARKDLDLATSRIQGLLTQSGADAEKIRNLGEEVRQLYQLNTQLNNNEEHRKQEHSNHVAALNSLRDEIRLERDLEIKEKADRELDRLVKLKNTWGQHEQQVKNVIKTICSRNNVEYVEKVPFKGEPDNTIRICNEYVIFDAKSPAGDDLKNFPAYLREQAEKAKKYTREEGVRKEIFLVVPTNALEPVSTYLYKLADFSVFVVSLDSLEPLIYSLQRLEDYEFAEQLSPEERDNICRVIGKFAHLTKRRIQIDTFFIRQFMELAYKSENDLPADVLEKVIEFEKAEKLNPPTERRSKQINMKDLEKETIKLSNETIARGIPEIETLITDQINKMPLYGSE